MNVKDKTLNTAYLHFDAFSIRDAIIQKLSADANFTDQLYAGSNLSILIDLVSIMYQSLMYNLNCTASETMFADTTVYENINRLVKFLGYNPRGYSTSQVLVDLQVNPGSQNIIYPFSYIDTGLLDSRGKAIYFSTIRDYNAVDNYKDGVKLSSQQITLYNGRWKLYNETLIAKGSAYETFLLPSLVSDSEKEVYIAYPHVVVYAKRTTGADTKWIKYSRVANIYANGSTLYTPNDNIFELRLNENKQFEIKFGNGINGSTLKLNDELYIFYLESNGPSGKINPGDIQNRPITLSPSTLGVTQDVFTGIFGQNSLENVTKLVTNKILVSNPRESSTPYPEETVAQIRNNAPAQFITAGRLVTAQDVASWVKRTYVSAIRDAVAMNNWKYISEFYGWLYNIGIMKYKDGAKYISPTILQKYDLAYTDAADSNTIYIWAKTYANAAIPETIVTDIDTIKPLTSNVVLLPPLNVNFALCIADENYVQANYMGKDTFDPANENYLEITVEDDLRYSPVLIKNSVNQTIKSYFSENNFTIGQLVDINALYDTLMNIPGIIRIRTVFSPKDADGNIIDPTNYIAKTGLCFATWTSSVVTPGDDLEISSIQRKLESFQFPALAVSDWNNKIKVITKNSNFSSVIS